MSIKLITEIFENTKGLSTPEKVVLLSIANHVNETDYKKTGKAEAYPSIALTAWRVEMSERQVQRIIRQLVSKGILIPVKHIKGGRQNATRYRIVLKSTEQKDQSTRPRFKEKVFLENDDFIDETPF